MEQCLTHIEKRKRRICFNSKYPSWPACTVCMPSSCAASKGSHALPARNRYSSRAGQVPYDTHTLAEQRSTHQVQYRERYSQTKWNAQHRLWELFISLLRKCSGIRHILMWTYIGVEKLCTRDCLSQHFSSRQTLYPGIQHTCFIYMSYSVTHNIKKNIYIYIYPQGSKSSKMNIYFFTSSLRIFLSETASPSCPRALQQNTVTVNIAWCHCLDSCQGASSFTHYFKFKCQ